MEQIFDLNKLLNEVQEKIKNLKHLNIIVAGKTGVGKSTLINQVFREKLADTGVGKPVTTHMRKYTKQGVPLTIYDTKGFELDSQTQDEVSNEIFDLIDRGAHSKDFNEAVHCIWYCISTASDRVEQAEIDWIKTLAERNRLSEVPVIVILTKSYSKKNAAEMKKVIEDENLDVIQIIPVLAEDFVIDDDITIKAYNLDRLIDIMTEVLPEELLDSLHNVQIVNLEEKRKRAHAIVAAAATATAGEGAVPIPFSDSFLMIPTQVGMIAGITAVYGIEVNSGIILTIITSTLGAGGATFAGKAIVSGLLKLIPGAGSVAGGAISAATGAALTTAIGEIYIAIADAIVKGEITKDELNTKEGKEKIKQMVHETGTSFISKK